MVDAAVRLADDRGLTAVTVRALAAQLGVSAMSVYTYVPTREVLVGLMVDAVALRTPVPRAVGDLRADLAAVVRARREEYLTHPWLMDVSGWRDVLGPGRLRRYETQLTLFEGLPIDDVERDALVTLLESYAAGSARSALGAEAVGAMSDAQWWQVVGPELASVMPASEFPLAGRVGTAVGERYEAPGSGVDGFEIGLAVLLDGVSSRVGGL
ncbi:TetR/AcrR family transcriptional regulator [Gordonia humi]|uniref:TetR/AcrR family transcriptional regulator n=1 Tax=Gordonia humi TaxID=686429 RepID=UPI0036202DC3